jgi:2-dehydropantoate 2-reductase
MHVLIFGTGAVGGIYAYIFEKSGAKVTAVCRSNYDTVTASGIHIKSEVFGDVIARPTTARTVEEAQGPFEFIVVCAKAFPGLSNAISSAIAASPDACVVLCQNGISIEEEYTQAYPNTVIISGVVNLPTTQIKPGHITMGALQKLEVGPYPCTESTSIKAKVRQFAELFSIGGGNCTVHDDIQEQRWIKLAGNAAWGPMCSLSRCDDVKYIQSSPLAEDSLRTVMREVAKIAEANGYPTAAQTIYEISKRPSDRLKTIAKEPSMLTDVRMGRQLEVEVILGNTLKIAKKHNVNTPLLSLLYTLTRALSSSQFS